MAYDHLKQYRAPIIRGRATRELDELLPLYASIVESCTPSSQVRFAHDFNRLLDVARPGLQEKTLNNHRTEIAGKLFGLYIADGDVVKMSQRASMVLVSQDQPAFFKDIVRKIQFPNPMAKPHSLKRQIDDSLSCVPAALVLTALREGESRQVALSTDELGYYVLNSLHALQGVGTPHEIIDSVLADRAAGNSRSVRADARNSSFNSQHIREFLGYMELANLIRIDVDSRTVSLNAGEERSVDFIISTSSDGPPFPVNLQDLGNPDALMARWDAYYTSLDSEAADALVTPIDALYSPGKHDGLAATDLAIPGEPDEELGRRGERLVHTLEQQRVSAFSPRLVAKVKDLSHIRGIGYDIQSVKARQGVDSEHAIFIEVKSTKRVTGYYGGRDSIKMTRNEWVAAEQYGRNYFLYRVYFTAAGASVFIIQNPAGQRGNDGFYAEPSSYVVEFDDRHGVFVTQET